MDEAEVSPLRQRVIGPQAADSLFNMIMYITFTAL